MPTTRKPQRSWSPSDASFSGKIPVCTVQMPSALGPPDELLEERPADPSALAPVGDIHAVLGHARVDAALRHWRERGPADAPRRSRRPQTVGVRCAAVPGRPGGSLGLEDSLAAGDPLLVDRPHRRPVVSPKLPQIPPCLAVEVEPELRRVGPEPDDIDLVLALVVDPGADQLLAEDAALREELVVRLEGVERLA